MILGKHINRYYLRFGFWLLLGLASLVLVDILQLEIPRFYRMVIDGMTYGTVDMGGYTATFDLDFLLSEICMKLIVVIIFMVLGRFLWRICFFGSAMRLEEDLRNRMFSHANRLSREYYQVNKVGDLMSLFTNDLDTVQECFGWGVMMFLDAILMGALAIWDMWQMDHLLTVLSLIPMGLLLACSTIVGKRMAEKWDIRQEAYAKLSDFSQESFSGIAVIKAFVREAGELLTFKKLNVENEESNVAHTKLSVLFRVLVTLFVESVTCIILGYGGYLVHEDVFTSGQLMEFIGYFTAIIWPIMAISELIDMTSRGRASLDRISQLLEAPVHVQDHPDAVDLQQVQGKICFRNLTFRYPDGEFDALKDISFTIEPGEHVGLAGKTGSGKTTLVDLILRTYNVPDGTLFIDDQDVNRLTIRSLRDGCAYVPQENFLFSDTIENNISFGVMRGDTDKVIHAAKLADVHSNIAEFQRGYDTVLGERGVTISGGQKQRISIARALIKDAPILILDDAVSAVDTKTETAILQNLRTTRAGKTTILIAHRVSTIESMDKILFIDDGQLAAVGTHETLYETNAAYRRMVDLQRLEEEGGKHNG